ncbi:MAG TPA: D-alanyl-D-alanine carboxypeptidase [Sporichthyaceae bacterium]
MPISFLRRAACAAVAAALALVPTTAADARVQSGPGPVPIGGARLGGHGVIAAPGVGALPRVTAPAWLIADAASGNVLAARDPHRQRRPASTQKTLLALTMEPRLNPNGYYRADRADTRVEGTHVGLVAGQTYSINDLWYGLFLRSGNDAANAIAKAGAGRDVARAVSMMRAEARHLQAYDTRVANPSGLDAPGQFASAYDLALWGRAALGHGDLRHYYGTLRHDFPGAHSSYQIYTQNRLIHHYPGAIGVKAGYTSLAHNTLIAAATRNGRTILVTLMGTRRNIYVQARTLLDWGFAHALVRPVGVLVSPLPALAPGDYPDPGRGPIAAGHPAPAAIPEDNSRLSG